LLPDALRQQPPFRYIGSPIALEDAEDERVAHVTLSASAVPDGTFGWVGGRLAGFLVIEALAQLSGLLIRGFGLGGSDQVGFLVSVASNLPLDDWYDIDALVLRSRHSSRVNNVLTFACSVAPPGGAERTLQIQIGLQDAD